VNDMHLVAAGCLQGQVQRIGNVFSPHVGAKLPRHDVAAVIIKDCAKIEPAPAENLDVGKVGLPKLIDGCRFVFELVCSLGLGMSSTRKQRGALFYQRMAITRASMAHYAMKF